MSRPPVTQQVTFIYTEDLPKDSAFMSDVMGFELVLNQNDTCHIYRVTGDSFLGVCTNRKPPENPGVTYTFVTPDVDGMYERMLANGVAFDGPPKLQDGFNVYACFFRGIGNYRFELQEFRDPTWPKPVLEGTAS